jgi:hypothetical protein
MDWKKFFLDKRKFVLTIVIAFFAILSLLKISYIGMPTYELPWDIIPIILNLYLILDFILIDLGYLVYIIPIIYWYLLSCLIVWYYDIVKKK